MFDVAPTELLAVALVALVVIGPKDLPKAMRVVGQWVGRAKTMARHFRGGIDTMIREAELEEMEEKWAAENERIMREHPRDPDATPHFADDAVDDAIPEPPAIADAAVTDDGGAAPTLFGPSEMPVQPPAKPKRQRARKAAP